MKELVSVKINVGCGATPTDGWQNFDNSLTTRFARWPLITQLLAASHVLNEASSKFAVVVNDRSIQYADASRRIPCANGSVDVVYSSHMIEHLDTRQAIAFLQEVRRVLRPSGIVRLAAPDLARLVRTYLDTGDADELIAGTHMGQPRPTGITSQFKLALIGPRNHLWMYDGPSLSRLLCKAGFTNVAIMLPGKTNISDAGSLDLEERVEESVYVEGFQPS